MWPRQWLDRLYIGYYDAQTRRHHVRETQVKLNNSSSHSSSPPFPLIAKKTTSSGESVVDMYSRTQCRGRQPQPPKCMISFNEDCQQDAAARFVLPSTYICMYRPSTHLRQMPETVLPFNHPHLLM